MKKLVFILLALCALGANAQLLWKVSGNGAKDTSWLFGTHHVAPPTLIDDIKPMRQAIINADAMYGEVDMASDPMALQQTMMKYAMAPTDSTLSAVLTTAQMDSLNTVLGKYTGGQLSGTMLEMMKPSVVSTQLAMLVNMTAFPDFNPTEQLDTKIQQIAAENGKTPAGLETAEQQFELLMGYPIKEQAADLMQTVAHESEDVEMAQKLAAAYLSQDLDAISALVFDPEEMNEKDAERLIYNRNNNWLKELQKILPQESAFIAVGVGHLVGERGLIEGLRRLGYTVEPATTRK